MVFCADNFGLSFPFAFFAAIGQAARQGVIVNGGEPLGRLGKATVVLFDKTGTLTYGHPRVETIELAKGVVEYDFWHLVGSGEKYSKHPLAKAMLDAVAARHIVPKDPEHFEAVRGKGVRALVDGRAFLSGSHAFLQEESFLKLPAKASLQHLCSVPLTAQSLPEKIMLQKSIDMVKILAHADAFPHLGHDVFQKPKALKHFNAHHRPSAHNYFCELVSHPFFGNHLQ